jgi:hypothetical protein
LLSQACHGRSYFCRFPTESIFVRHGRNVLESCRLPSFNSLKANYESMTMYSASDYNHVELEKSDVLPILVHVTAPATLPAGYTFEAEINGDPDKVFTCEVVRVASL